MILLKNSLLPVSNCIYASERIVIIKVGDLLCINVYFPCVGTVDRQLICEEILSDIYSWRYKYPECGCIGSPLPASSTLRVKPLRSIIWRWNRWPGGMDSAKAC